MNERPGEYPNGPDLPPELAAFLSEQEIACLMQATDQGTAFVVKLPAAEIASVGGSLPVQVSHELYTYPAAPVIRTVLRLFDQPESHLALETFTNIADPVQRADFAALLHQDQFMMLFYDEQLHHRLTKHISHTHPERIEDVLSAADSLLSHIPPELFNFEHAKQAVLVVTKL